MQRFDGLSFILLPLALAGCGDDGVVGANTAGDTDSGTDTSTDTDADSMTSVTESTTVDTNDSQSTTNQTTDPGTTSSDTSDGTTTGTDGTSTMDTDGTGTDTDDTTTDTDDTTTDTDSGGTAGTTGGSTGSSSTGTPACLVDDDCNDLDGPCQSGVCNAGTCEAQLTANDTPCDTGDMCMLNEACTDGECIGESVDCSAFDTQCTVGVCDPLDGTCGAEAANEGDPCDDGMICSYGDACAAGACIGLTDPIFEEPFADNSQGWELEGKWEIDVAMVSDPGTISGETDPAEDHTDTADEGLAGILIGGLSGPPGHAPQYLTSPVIDLSVLDPDADKELRFWRHLVSSAAFAIETIDVWDGANWINVYTSPGTIDTDWTEIVIDLDSYTNDDFQVRFGHEISDVAVGPAEPSWSIDDITVGPVCP